jgi:imidazole glycerol-phosphate synthase subunit HisH
MSGRLGIVDYGMGNLRSVQNALQEIGAIAELVQDAQRVATYDKVILPGVGAFREAIENLRRRGMESALHEFFGSGKPILGICLGMQLMCSDSLEGGLSVGFGWIQAHVVPFSPNTGNKVPHMGWNSIEFKRDDAIFDGVSSGSDAYFVHSYYVSGGDGDGYALATTEYGSRFVSMLRQGNAYGMQFHPEKSQQTGLRLLKNFVAL